MFRSAVACLLLCAAASAQWGFIPVTGPSPRTKPLMGYEILGNRVLMFGGNWSNEMWSLQNGTWSQLTPATLPPPRSKADLAVDELTGAMMLYGGLDGSNRYAMDDTWTWNGTDWTPVTSAMTPGGLAGHSMAYDIVRQRFVLFGGFHDSWWSTLLMQNTWEFGNGTWSQASTLTPPPARRDAAMAYHLGTGRIVMFGGEDATGQATDDTWQYDGIDWVQTNVAGVKPPARTGAKMVPVLNRNILVLFGGRDPITMEIRNDTWEYDGVTWSQVNNVYGGVYPPRAEFGMAHDFVNDRITLFGGVIANNSVRGDTWEYGAQVSSFGNGCPGSNGVPALSAAPRPRLGITTTVTLGNLPAGNNPAMLVLGNSRTQWVNGPLPALLTSFGMPNCRAYVSTDLITMGAASGGSASWTFSVPYVAQLVGYALHGQGVSFDPGINAAGATTSNALTFVLGN